MSAQFWEVKCQIHKLPNILDNWCFIIVSVFTQENGSCSLSFNIESLRVHTCQMGEGRAGQEVSCQWPQPTTLKWAVLKSRKDSAVGLPSAICSACTYNFPWGAVASPPLWNLGKCPVPVLLAPSWLHSFRLDKVHCEFNFQCHPANDRITFWVWFSDISTLQLLEIKGSFRTVLKDFLVLWL